MTELELLTEEALWSVYIETRTGYRHAGFHLGTEAQAIAAALGHSKHHAFAKRVEVPEARVAEPVDMQARFIYSSGNEVLPQGKHRPGDQEVTMPASAPAARKPDLSALSAKLIAEVKSTFPEVELTQKASYVRAHVGRLTLGYLYPSPNGGKSAVETPIGDGKYQYQSIASAGDLRKAVASMKKVEAKASKAAAKAAAKNGR